MFTLFLHLILLTSPTLSERFGVAGEAERSTAWIESEDQNLVEISELDTLEGLYVNKIAGLSVEPSLCSEGEWSNWGQCNEPCGTEGKVSRSRTDSGCEKEVQSKLCYTQCVSVCNEWSEWSSCSCTTPLSTRIRSASSSECSKTSEIMPCPECTDYSIAGGDSELKRSAVIVGDADNIADADDHDDNNKDAIMLDFFGLPSNAGCEWGRWGKWSDCTCNAKGKLKAWKVRSRNSSTCATQTVKRLCKRFKCEECEVGEWSQWEECQPFDVCGDGTQNRTRAVDEGNVRCPPAVESAACDIPCSSRCGTGQWTEWSECVEGSQTRYNVPLTEECPDISERRGRVECGVGEWGEWSECKAGSAWRVRDVLVQPLYTECPVLEQREGCAVPCNVSEWGQWSECNKGYQFRSREVSVQPYKASCPDLAESQACSVECLVSEWGEWGGCEEGVRLRFRGIVIQPYRAQCPPLVDEEPCVTECVVGEWEGWGECESEVEKRIRYVTTRPFNADCPLLEESRDCAPQCQYGEWGDWREGCWNCKQWRRRPILDRKGLKRCPGQSENRDCCKVESVECGTREWGEWSQCSHGSQTRARESADIPAMSECGSVAEERECNECSEWGEWGECVNGHRERLREGCLGQREVCEVRCEVGQWLEWSPCRDKMQTRIRQVVLEGVMCPVLDQSQTCLMCEVSQWSEWGTCYNRSRQRGRRVVQASSGCPDLAQSEACSGCTAEEANGIWTEWNECSPQCGEDRVGVHEFTFNDGSCPSLTETKTCPSTTCLSDCRTSGWGQWSECTCGNDRQRKRVEYLGECIEVVQATSCGPESCLVPVPCVQSGWSRWGSCSKECIGCDGVIMGKRVRQRKTEIEARNGAPPCPLTTQSKLCKTKKLCENLDCKDGDERGSVQKYLEYLQTYAGGLSDY